MIVKINGRGHSFKGVMAYLMHDKEARSADRVAWHETGNLHTNDPEAAARFMAWTERNAEQLKAETGVSPAGRKAEAGGVYHYSLSWAHGETPEQAHQRAQAQATLDHLGLSRHQYVFISHNDTQHAHVHVVVNLTDHETGKRASLHFDKTALQEWALEYEREHGLHCDKRLENARRREQGEPTKHQDERQDYADRVRQAYEQADSGKAFAAALEAQGLTLASGRRGGAFVIVDEHGDIQKLSRQIEGVKAAQIKARLADLDPGALPVADQLARERAQALEQQRPAAEPKTSEKPPVEDKPAQESPSPRPPSLEEDAPRVPSEASGAQVHRPEEERATLLWRKAKAKEIEDYYKVAALQEQHRQAVLIAQKKATFWGWLTGQQRRADDTAEAMRRNLENAQMRQAEALQALVRQMPPAEEIRDPDTNRGPRAAPTRSQNALPSPEPSESGSSRSDKAQLLAQFKDSRARAADQAKSPDPARPHLDAPQTQPREDRAEQDGRPEKEQLRQQFAEKLQQSQEQDLGHDRRRGPELER